MRQARWLAAAALAVVLLALAGWIAMDSAVANAATPAQPEPVCATWGLRSITTGPGWLDEPAAGSKVVNESKVKITKPEGGGTEFAAFDLDIEAASETLVSVKYKLHDGAATSAGAVRLFGYADKDANTLADDPDWKAVAEAEQGTLILTLGAGSMLGTLGVVYDASNSAAGHVVFSQMTIGDQPVSFTECPEPTPSPSATTPAPTTPPATPPATDPAATPSAMVPPVAGGPSLPVTGVNLQQVVTGAVLLLIGGAMAFLLAPRLRRRKQTTFEA